MPKKIPPPGFKCPTFRLRSITLTITLQELCLQGILLLILSLCFGCKGLGLAWLQLPKNNFSGSKKMFFFFFRTALMTLRDARLSKKTTFQALIVFFALFFETQRSPALQNTTFSGSKKLFFPHCSNETQRSSPLQKKIRLLKIVFAPLTL